jgi:hypothetical protein
MYKAKYLIFYFLICFLINADAQTLNVPVRSSSAMSGTQFVNYITAMSLTNRENAIFTEVMNGNVPAFMRNMIPVNSTATISGTVYTATYYVIPDYLAIGCDSDYFLCPMTPLLAQQIADQLACTLPTRKMVNDIWTAATVHLSPSTISPSAQMTTVPVFATHDSTVWVQRSAVLAAHPLGELVGGDKKDVIISNHIYGNPSPGRVVIYGWHYTSGTPIQPLYYGHEETYADYSHGIRMVQLACTLNGSASTVNDILISSTYNTVLSDEGAISTPRYPVGLPQVNTPTSFCALRESSTSIRIKITHESLNSGYFVQTSTNGISFGASQVFADTNFLLTNLLTDSIYYIRIAAFSNADTSAWSEVLAAAPSSFSERVLVVNGFDRASTGNTYNFIRQHGKAILKSGYIFSSATNDAVLNGLVNLQNYSIIDWILGDESTANETFSTAEQGKVSSFLNNGGKLFVSGSEIAWDLDNKGSTTDKSFYNNYLKAQYVNDAPNGQSATYYNITPVTSQFFSNLSQFSFDNGTHGTINVKYPDVINGINGGINCFYYTSLATNYSGVCYTGNFPSGSVQGKLVNLGFPFETVYPDTSSRKLMNRIMAYFEPSPSATLTAYGQTTFCQGDSITLAATDDFGNTYQWIMNGNNITNATHSSLTIHQSGNYAVFVYHNGQTALSPTIPITVNQNPTAAITTTDLTAFCSGNSAVLTATSGSGYSFQWFLNGNAIQGATNSVYSASLQGNYNVNVTANTCSSISNPIAITTWSSPIAFAGNDTSVCYGSYITLIATGGFNYQWDHSVLQNIPFMPTATTAYNVTVTNVSGCSNTDDVTVNVNALPQVPTITQYNHYLLSSAANSYQWYDSNGIITGDTIQLFIPPHDGLYYVLITDANGCSAQSQAFNYITTGINSFSGQDLISDYFNHSNNTLTIKNNSSIVYQTIFILSDSRGNQLSVKQFSLKGNQSTVLDLSGYASGIYFAKLISDQFLKTEKLVMEK